MTNLELPSGVAALNASAEAQSKRSTVRRLLDALYAASALSGAVAVFSVLILMLLQAGYRKAGYLFRGADDLTAWACAAAVFLPLAYTFKKGELVRMGLVMDHFRGAARRVFEIFSILCAGLFTGYATYWAVNLTYQSWLIDDRAQGLIPVPMWIPQSSMSVGLAILLVAIVDEGIVIVRGREPTYELEVRQRRSGGDFSGEL